MISSQNSIGIGGSKISKMLAYYDLCFLIRRSNNPFGAAMDFIDSVFEEHLAVMNSTRSELSDTIAEAARLIVECYEKGGKVVLFGNGGSAADALHLEGEFLVRFRFDRSGLPAIAIGSGLSALTAASNDYSFDEAFAHIVKAHIKPHDVAIALSTSGNSANVVEAARAAYAAGAAVIGMTGADGGALRETCTILLNVPSPDTPRIQEAHITIGHIICELVERSVFKKD